MGVDLKEVPANGATDPQRRAWIEALFSLPDGFAIGEPTRFGATSSSPMTVPILGPGGNVATTVRFEEEREISNPKALRSALTRDADLRGTTITSAKVAGDAYYVLCKLARVVGRSDPLGEAGEWIDEYRRVSLRLEESDGEKYEFSRRGGFKAVKALRDYRYSKRAINLYLAALERGQGEGLEPPRPPLLIDARTGRAWTSVTHLGTYIRHDRDRPGTISDGALVGRVLEHGCERRALNVWDRSDRKRSERINIVLIGFPEPGEPPDRDDLDGLDEAGLGEGV